ncbi:hypothetical protein [Haploplasma modicum]|uniref:hypothetical protein n=1 Tax=Haploplasma modicum TaxID=2150 RepID=UPI00138AD5DB|nr:hypothetical protein [Haploplasma modicum]
MIEIENFKEIKLVGMEDVRRMVPEQVVHTLLEAEIFHYSVDKLAQSGKSRNAVANKLNNIGLIKNTSARFSGQDFLLDSSSLDENMMISKSDISNMFNIITNLNITNFKSIKVNNPNDVEAIINRNDFERLFDIKSLHGILDNISQSLALRTLVADLVNKQLAKAKINVKLDEKDLVFPDNVLVDNKVSKLELNKLVNIFFELNVDDFKELSSIKTITDVKSIVTPDYFDLLIDSEFIYYVVGKVPQSDKVLEKVASVLSNQVKSRLNIDHTFNKESLLFGEYGALELEGKHKGYITKPELTTIFNAFYLFNTDTLGGNIFTLANNVIDELLSVNNGNLVVDLFLESKIVTGMIDRGINVDNKDENQKLYLNIINKFLKTNYQKEDNIFKYHNNAFENGRISRDEIVRVLNGLDILNITKTPNVRTFTSLIGRNLEAGLDDFDRAYDSYVLQSIISNIALNDKTLEKGVSLINGRQGKFNFTKELLALPNSVVSENLIKKEEIKHLLNTLVLLELEDLYIKGLNVETFTNLIEDKEYDKLDQLLESTIIHTYIDRIIKSEELGFTVRDIVADMFDKDISGVNTKPEANQFDENGMFSKDEIRSMLVSIKLLGIKEFSDASTIKFETIISLVDKGEMNDFLDSNYIRVLVSRLLMSNTVKNQIASSGKFNDSDLDLRLTEKDPYGNMTQEEVVKLFNALNILGVKDLNDVKIDNEVLKSLTDEQLDLVLESNYFYQVISLTLIAQINEIPEESFVDETNESKLIKKSEVKGLIKALDILDINDPNDVNADTITVDKLEELVNLNSSILNRMITVELEKVFNNIIIPEDSYVDFSSKIKVLRLNELEGIIEALHIMASGNTPLSQISFGNNITTLQFSQLLNIDDSLLMTRIISDSVESALVKEGKLHPLAYESNGIDIKFAELEKLNASLVLLEIKNLSEGLKIDNVTTAKIMLLHLEESYIIDEIISNQIKNNLNKDITYNLTDSYDIIERNEVRKFIDALLSSDLDINKIEPETLTLKQIELMLDEDSKLVNRLVSTELIKALETSIPKYLISDYGISSKEIEKTEVSRLIASLREYRPSDDVEVSDFNGLNANLITVVDLIKLRSNKSLIIERMVSNAIIEVMSSDIPEHVKFVDLDLVTVIKSTEIDSLIEALMVFGINVTVTEIANTNFAASTISLIKEVNSKDSEIIRIKTSNAIKASDKLVMPDKDKSLDSYDEFDNLTKIELDRFFNTLVKIDQVMNPESEGTIESVANKFEDSSLVELGDYLVIANEYQSEILVATINHYILQLIG